MAPSRFCIRRLHHVSLRVRDLQRSVAFYRDVFGLVRVEVEPPSERACLCVGAGNSGAAGIGVALTEGLPPGTELAGLDHFSFEVAAAEDVSASYHQAKATGALATHPRVFDGHWQTFIFDPDGYKIEVLAPAAVRPSEGAFRVADTCAAASGVRGRTAESTG